MAWLCRGGLSSLGLGLLSACGGNQVVEQHGQRFELVQQGREMVWVTELELGDGSVKLPFHHLPDSTTTVPIKGDTLAWLGAAERRPGLVWVSVDPAGSHFSMGAAADLTSAIEQGGMLGGAVVKRAFTKPNERPEPLPVVGCDQAGPDSLVFAFEQSPAVQIRRSGHCVHIGYLQPQDAERVVERLVYGLFGVL
jgi:hypothetical protein